VTYPQQFPQQAPPTQQWGQQPAAPQQFAPPAQQPQFPAPPQPEQQQQQWAQQPAGAESLQGEDTSDMFGGSPSISWDNTKGYVNGSPRGGLIVGKSRSQQTDFETKQPKFFQGGRPMMQIALTVQTRERTDANDDGKRTIFVKGDMTRKAAQSFRAVGATDLELGGWFYAAKVSSDGGKNGKGNVFQTVYARPGTPDPLANQPAYVAPMVPQAPPVQQQFQAPPAPNYPPPGQQQWAPQAPAAPQQFAPPAQQPTAPPQFGAPQPPQGYADPSQGQQQFAPQGPAQPQFGQQAPSAGGGAPADYNPFKQ
jgi:hypothetical protein